MSETTPSTLGLFDKLDDMPGLDAEQIALVRAILHVAKDITTYRPPVGAASDESDADAPGAEPSSSAETAAAAPVSSPNFKAEFAAAFTPQKVALLKDYAKATVVVDWSGQSNLAAGSATPAMISK